MIVVSFSVLLLLLEVHYIDQKCLNMNVFIRDKGLGEGVFQPDRIVLFMCIKSVIWTVTHHKRRKEKGAMWRWKNEPEKQKQTNPIESIKCFSWSQAQEELLKTYT